MVSVAPVIGVDEEETEEAETDEAGPATARTN